MEGKPVILLDGSSLAYRAFYALPRLQTSRGRPTGATLGFLNMLLRLLDAYQPFTVVATFDHPQKTFRHEIYKEYKAKRKPMPDEMKPQLGDTKELLSAMDFLVLEKAGFEGDDLIGSVVAQLKNRHSLIIVTNDLDLLQLLDKETILLQPVRGVAQLKKIDMETLRSEWGILPQQVVDVFALAGDPSDNIQGVPGIGEKTALKLIREFGSWEQILAQRQRLPSHLSEILWEYRERIEENRALLRIKTDVPVETIKVEEWNWQRVRWEELLQKLGDLELKNLSERIKKKARFFPEVADPSGQNVITALFRAGRFWFFNGRQEGPLVAAENLDLAGGKELFLFLDFQEEEWRWEEDWLRRERVWCAPTLLFLAYPFLHLEIPFLFEFQKGGQREQELRLFYLEKSRTQILAQPGLHSLYRRIEGELLKMWFREQHRIKGFTLYPFLKPPNPPYDDLPLFGKRNDLLVNFEHLEWQKFLEEEWNQKTNCSEECPFCFRTLYGWRFLATQPVEEKELRRRFRKTLLDELIRLSIFILGKEMNIDVSLSGNTLRGNTQNRDLSLILRDFEDRLSSLLP
ncbi:MAG: 5'-3' exonuclease, partial [Candidatus Caldatribacteriaceae bacterium]